MEGAQPHVASGGAHALEAHVFSRHLDDVDRRFELLDEFHAYCGGGCFKLCHAVKKHFRARMLWGCPYRSLRKKPRASWKQSAARITASLRDSSSEAPRCATSPSR